MWHTCGGYSLATKLFSEINSVRYAIQGRLTAAEGTPGKQLTVVAEMHGHMLVYLRTLLVFTSCSLCLD